MSDYVYVPDDVPDSYHYAYFDSNSVTLYDKPYAENETLSGYKIFYNYSSGLVVPVENDFYTKLEFYDVPISRSVLDRPDNYKIVCIGFILIICGLWITNYFTSFVRKGGVLSGLF